jgi:WD40 repeat protein
LLYAPAPLEPLPQVQGNTAEVVTIDPCHVVAHEKLEVCCTKDGRFLFIGQEIVEGSLVLTPKPLKVVKVFPGTSSEQLRAFRPWKEGEIVEEGQMLALVDPALAIGDVWTKQAKVFVAKAELEMSKALFNEAAYRVERLADLKRRGVRIVTDEEWGTAVATKQKYEAEVNEKTASIDVAKTDKLLADYMVTQHELRNTLSGKSVIKKIYKLAGEGVKAQDTVMQLYNISHLRVEGSIGSQYLSKLQPGLPCYLEPSVELAPDKEWMQFHRREVNSVAVCADGERFVSGSEDKTICAWQRGRPAPVSQLAHQAAVRVVVCSPTSSLAVAGCADGSICIWDLDKQLPIRCLNDQHRGAVSALAFSPDGRFFASGGEDHGIVLWNIQGDKLYSCDADESHQGTVTSLHFTPQCKLVSAARDNTLRLWTLYQKGAAADGEPLAHRGGNVGQLGVSADGRFLLFDQGKTLQLINSSSRATVCSLDNLAGSNPFDTLALLSPSGQLLLTGGAGEGHLQLWKTPTAEDRAYHVRELVTKERSAITSAAFGPAGKSFAVTGSKDGHVHYWGLPDEAAVQSHRIFLDAQGEPLKLDFVDQALDGNKTRVAVNVHNPQERLLPGQRVTLVVMLPAVK